MPDETFDFRKHQLIPGRSLMCRNLEKIHRHQTEIERIEGNELILKDGEKIKTDFLLWATGYRMDLSYLGLPEYKKIKKLDDLIPRLGSLTRSLDYPNLFFLSMTILGSTSATPLFSAIEARSIVSHILGKCEIPKKNIPHLVNHWDLFSFHARFDRYNYSRYWWRLKYLLLALINMVLPWRTVRI